MPLTIVIIFIVAWIRKLNPLLIFKSWTVYPVFAFEIVLVYFQVQVFRGNYWVVEWAELFKSSYMFLFLIPMLAFKLYKQGIIGSAFILSGTMLNKLVMHLNGGKMPVFPTLSYYTGYVKADTFTQINDIHILGDGSTKAIFLSDIIDVGYSILSIGDILIRVFVFLILYAAIVKMNLKYSVKTRMEKQC